MKAELRESDIEDYLVKRVKACGGEVRKLKWIGRNSAPDRVVLLNGIAFVEIKAPKKKPTAAQRRELARLENNGVGATYVSSFAEVDRVIEYQLNRG